MKMKTGIRFLGLLLSLAMVLGCFLVVSFAAASSGTCGENLTWTLEDGVLTISGSGKMADYSSSKPTAVP